MAAAMPEKPRAHFAAGLGSRRGPWTWCAGRGSHDASDACLAAS